MRAPNRAASSAGPRRERVSQDVRDLVELSRLLVSVAYRSLDVPEASVPLPQFRALAIL
jgi:hypothetical protein